MFMVSDKCCPNCGITGKKWKEKPEIFVCPLCSAVFSEFGIVSIGEEQEVSLS